MFIHNKKLQYTVRVSEPNPVLATLMLEQFGGPQGELAAAMRYFTQGLAEDDAGRKDLLLDIATEELSHLEIIGSIVSMLNKGVRAQLAEGAMVVVGDPAQQPPQAVSATAQWSRGTATTKAPRDGHMVV